MTEAMIALGHRDGLYDLEGSWDSSAGRFRSGSKVCVGVSRPPLIVGVVLTLIAGRVNAVPSLLPGVWLCMYGVAIIAGGAFSVRVIPIMGVGFLCAGIAAFCTPPTWGNAWLASAFGGLHIIFGAIIARRYGG